MKDGIQKLLRKLVLKKYPMYLDVYVHPYIEGSLRYDNPFNRNRYEVILVINAKDFREDMYSEISEYVRDIAKYMDVEVMGLYNKVVDDEEWEKMNSDETPSW
jgi:hypothetical protein